MPKLAWVPAFAGMTVERAQTACLPFNAIPPEGAIHASLREDDGEEE